jgi:hypothetical protein
MVSALLLDTSGPIRHGIQKVSSLRKNFDPMVHPQYVGMESKKKSTSALDF